MKTGLTEDEAKACCFVDGMDKLIADPQRQVGKIIINGLIRLGLVEGGQASGNANSETVLIRKYYDM